MIRLYDTLEIPLRPDVRFSERVFLLKKRVEKAATEHRIESELPYSQNIYYGQVIDLRRVADVGDIEAVLHLNAKKTGSHKVQILEAGHKYAGGIAETIAKIIDDHPDSCSISRVDSCADFLDGPGVAWIAQSTRVKGKRWQAEFGEGELREEKGKKVPWSEMGNREVQTMYQGKRPNCFRCYNKRDERQNAWMREKRRHERLASQVVRNKALEGGRDERNYPLHSGAELRDLDKHFVSGGRLYIPFPDFEPWLVAQSVGPSVNLSQLPKTWTRVERQMGAGRVPEALDTFKKIFSPHVLRFNPFERVEFSSCNVDTQIDMEDFSPVEFAAGLQFQQWLEAGMSYQQLYAYWNRNYNGKAIAEKFAPFVAAANSSKAVSITASDLYERYRSSVSNQMAA